MKNEIDILDSGISFGETKLVQAEKGKRFTNYLIDALIGLVLYYCIGIAIILSSDTPMNLLEQLEENAILD